MKPTVATGFRCSLIAAPKVQLLEPHLPLGEVTEEE